MKKNLELTLVNQLGEEVTQDIFLLIEKISGKDTYIDRNIWMNLQNIVCLSKEEATHFVTLALELSLTSAVVSVLLFEKIPTLIFYGITKEVSEFLCVIKDYGSRALAYYLGCDQLKIDDLLHILEHSTISYYKDMLAAVTARHHEFGICCSLLMRYSAKIEPYVSRQKIGTYLDICSKLVKTYGTKIAEKYIQNSHEIMSNIPLDKNLDFIESLVEKSLLYAEFCLTYPALYFSNQNNQKSRIVDFNKGTENDIKLFKIELLKNELYLDVFEHKFLVEDRDFMAFIMAWPTLSYAVKENILFQLQKDNYKHYILTHSEIENERQLINQSTQDSWLKSWTFCGETVDLTYIRKRMGVLLQDPQNFSLEAKSIIKQHPMIFDRANTVYDNERIANMITVLLGYCNGEDNQIELSAFAYFVAGNRTPLNDLLSKNNLVIQACERDPWSEYGRSDELFSCTSLGEYNAGNAPAFLADLNLSNLDIWNNGARVGRIHLCLIKDSLNDTLLLLDCVDGSERVIGSKKKFELVMASVMEYARWLGIKKMVVNYDVDYNTTPKRFIAYVESIFKEQAARIDYYSRMLAVTTTNKLLAYPCQTFTESFSKNNGAYIRGPLISL